MGRAVLCRTCLYCGGCPTGNNTTVVRKHCQRHHKGPAAAPGVSPSGRSWRRLNDAHPHILVALPWDNPVANGKTAVGLCSLCGEHWHPDGAGHFPRAGAEAWFATHTCHTPQTRTYKAVEPAGGAGMSAKSGTVKGTIISDSHLLGLRKKYPGFPIEYASDAGDDDRIDVRATLEAAARDCDRLDKIEVAARKNPGATGDFHTAALMSLKEDPRVAAQIQLVWDQAKDSYESDQRDWDEEDEHDEDAVAPDPTSVPREALLSLALQAIKLKSAEQATKAAVARAEASLEAELMGQRRENSTLIARNLALERSVAGLSSENARLNAEVAALRAALAAATKSDD